MNALLDPATATTNINELESTSLDLTEHRLQFQHREELLVQATPENLNAPKKKKIGLAGRLLIYGFLGAVVGFGILIAVLSTIPLC